MTGRGAARLGRPLAASVLATSLLGFTQPAAPPVSAPSGAAAFVGQAEPPPGWPAPPAISARSVLLFDTTTGQILAARRADERVPVASTVKVLTALSVLRRAELTDVVTIGPEVVGIEGASVALDPGEAWSVEDLLEGLIARSGNDAAVALAVHVGGSVEGFLALMAQDAAALGAGDVTLRSPNGLDDTNRLSARDLGVISSAAMSDARFAAIAARPTVELPEAGLAESRNELLMTYPGATGVKTGFTEAAGECLVATATRDGRSVMTIVLDSEDHFTDTTALLDFGFNAFERQDLLDVGVAARLRTTGAWVDVNATLPLEVLSPRGEPASMALELPVELVPAPPTAILDVRWQDQVLGTTTVTVAPVSEAADLGGRGVGSWLWDRAYAVMRGATAAEAWPP